MEIKGTNEKTHIILKYDDKTHKFVDITKDIYYIKDNFNYWYVVFCSNNKPYKIAKSKMKVSDSPETITFEKEKVFIDNKVLNDLTLILKFPGCGYKLFFKDCKTKFVSNLKVEDGNVYVEFFDYYNIKSNNNVFDYYKELSKYASDCSLNDSSIESIMFNLYLKINQVNRNSVLYEYTNLEKDNSFSNKTKIIYPFSTNYTQISAIKNTFSNTISVISGPPGTGKTQVILNLIASSIINGYKIAVISNNNTAVENVYERMADVGLEFLIAYLGNSDNVDKFFSKPDDILNRISSIKYSEKQSSVEETCDQIQKLYKKNNELFSLKQKLYEAEEELNHYKSSHDLIDYSSDIPADKTLDFYIKLKYRLLSLRKVGFINNLNLKRKFKFKNFKLNEINNVIDYLDFKILEANIIKYQNDIDSIITYIENNKLSDLNLLLKDSSLNELYCFLNKKYLNTKPCTLNKDNYKKYFDNFIDRYPVILSTTYSLLRNIQYGFMFDLVIIDEASQSDIMSTLLTMNVTKQIVVVGDSKQLSQIDNQNIYERSLELKEKYDISDYYEYKDNSILQSILNLPINVPNTILKEHYRCDSRIIGFCNKKFYNNELVIYTSTSKDDPLIVIHTVAGNHARKNPNGSGQYNDREAKEILEIIEENKDNDIGVITPFRAQADYIKSLIEENYKNIEVDTIHKYQGRQKDIIILSTVVNDLHLEEDDFITNFVTNKQLLNVAISRAIKKLYIVVSDKIYNSKNNLIKEFIDYINYYCSNSSDQNGQITSIFDCLYDAQNMRFRQSSCNKYVDSFAEDVALAKLNDIIKSYPDLKLQLHYRLSDLIKNYDGFDEREVKYIKHPRTHVDFVIFNKITRNPVLCIEVDGTRYHDYAKVQIEHDKIKDRILIHNNIDILRLKTNQSGEEDRIKKYLEG